MTVVYIVEIQVEAVCGFGIIPIILQPEIQSVIRWKPISVVFTEFEYFDRREYR
jgi:hypothetical protein